MAEHKPEAANTWAPNAPVANGSNGAGKPKPAAKSSSGPASKPASPKRGGSASARRR